MRGQQERIGMREKIIAVGFAFALGLTACSSSTETQAIPQAESQETTIPPVYVDYHLEYRYENGVLETRLLSETGGTDSIVSRGISQCQGPDLTTLYTNGGGGDRISPYAACEDDGFLDKDEIENLIPAETITPTSTPR